MHFLSFFSVGTKIWLGCKEEEIMKAMCHGPRLEKQEKPLMNIILRKSLNLSVSLFPFCNVVLTQRYTSKIIVGSVPDQSNKVNISIN